MIGYLRNKLIPMVYMTVRNCEEEFFEMMKQQTENRTEIGLYHTQLCILITSVKLFFKCFKRLIK
jgi:hypothetical protein